jgi:hypothetical protein
MGNSLEKLTLMRSGGGNLCLFEPAMPGGRPFLVKSQVILYTFFKFKGVRIQPG